MITVVLVALAIILSYLHGFHRGKKFMKVVLGNFITHRRLEAMSDMKLSVDSYFFTVLNQVERKLKEL